MKLEILLAKLEERLSGMETGINAKFKAADTKQTETLAQVTKTNGRVTALEAWRERLKGAGVVLIALGGVAITAITLAAEYFFVH